MSASRLISMVLIAIGCILIIFGINAADSLSSDISNLFTGNPSDKAIWLLIGGTVLMIAGVSGMLRGQR